jgi:hypothetical protein
MSRDLDMEIGILQPEQTDQECTRKEILKHFPRMNDPTDPTLKILEEIYRTTNGNIPQSLRLFAERIKDPLDIAVISYLIGQGLTEDMLRKALSDQLPELVKESMRAGAKMAMDHINKDPEPNPFPVTDPSADPQYQ